MNARLNSCVFRVPSPPSPFSLLLLVYLPGVRLRLPEVLGHRARGRYALGLRGTHARRTRRHPEGLLREVSRSSHAGPLLILSLSFETVSANIFKGHHAGFVHAKVDVCEQASSAPYRLSPRRIERADTARWPLSGRGEPASLAPADFLPHPPAKPATHLIVGTQMGPGGGLGDDRTTGD